MHGGYRKGAGRKKGYAAKEAEAARKVLAEMVSTEVRAIGQALIEKAKKGDVAAAKELFDRAWGKAPPAIEMEAVEPIKYTIVNYSDVLP